MLRPVVQIARTEWRLQWRDPVSLAFIVLFPALMVWLNGQPVAGQPPLAMLAMLVLGPIMFGMMALPTTIVGYRERGMLRRLRMTPLSPLTYLLVQVAIGAALTWLGGLLALLAGVLHYRITLPAQPLWLVAGFGLGALALIAVGTVIASVLRSTRTVQVASIILSGLLLLTMLLPADSVSPLARISHLLPARMALDVMLNAWQPGAILLPLVGLLLWVGGGLALAVRLFRWE